MPLRPNSTILLITRDRLVRADFDRGGRLAGLAEQASPEVEDFPSLVEAALGLGRARLGRVWVLTSEIWTQTLTLPEETVAALGPAELQRAVAFEAEPLSGVSAPDSDVGCVSQGEEQGQRRVWLVQVPRATVEQVEYVVRQAGGRLAGMGHPAGLPRPLLIARERAPAWQRIELWPGAMIVAAGRPEQASSTLVINSDPKSGHWRDDLARWLPGAAPAGHQETLHAAMAVPRGELDPVACLSLEDRDAVGEFLTAWAAELAAKTPAVPLVHPAKKPLSARAQWARAFALAAVGLLACVGHYQWTRRAMEVRAAETARLNGPIKASQAARKEIADLAKQRGTLEAACAKREEDLAHCRKMLAAQQDRLCVLLTALAQPELEDYIIQRIEGSADELVLHGICLRPHVSNGLAAVLGAKVEPLGWRVELPDKHAIEMLTDRGPWQFELRVRDALAAQQAQAATAATAKPGTKPSDR